MPPELNAAAPLTIPSSAPPSAFAWMRHLRYTDLGCTVSEFVVLLLFAGYFLFYGLIPIFGGDQLGLVGADEPRYAQIAREMLAAHSADCHAVHARIVPRSLRPADLHASYVCLMGGTVTPILYGKPWLEKPASRPRPARPSIPGKTSSSAIPLSTLTGTTWRSNTAGS